MKTIQSLFIYIIFIIITSCVQDTHLKTIYFKVDMSKVDKISNPSVKGQFTSLAWQEAINLTDINGDGIYEAKIEVQAAQLGMQFKFVNANTYELEGQNNRFIQFEYKPQTLIYECVFNDPNGNQSEISNN